MRHSPPFHLPPAYDGSYAPGVTGKSGDHVVPATKTREAASIAIACAWSASLPPMNVENTTPPVASNFVTNVSFTVLFRSNAFRVVGKSGEAVWPATYAFPRGSAAIPVPKSWREPPKYVG